MMENQISFNTPCDFRAKGVISIRENVDMSQTNLIENNGVITIGDNVKLGGGDKVYATNYHCLEYLKRRDPRIYSVERERASFSIDDACYIGAGIVILKGVHVGTRSIIGAGIVVNKDIPEDVFATGNPCKVKRSLQYV